MAQLSLEEVNFNIEQLHKDFKELKKMYEHILSVQNEIYKDRDILTDISDMMVEVKKAIVRVDVNNKNLTTEIKDTVELTAEQVKDKTDEVKKTLPAKIADKIETTFDKKAILKKKSIFGRIAGRFSHK